MKALQLTSMQHGPRLTVADVLTPTAGDGEVLIRVHAAGVTPTELQWYPTTHTKEDAARIGAIPGHEFSGVVAAVGGDVAGFQVGDTVYGMNDWFADGATAEFCVTAPQSIALKPEALSHELAATVPIGALTAWQGLLDRAKIQRGERVLIHGGSGAVGLFAVQLAHLHGAEVIATASGKNLDFVKKLGAVEVIDYQTARFEDTATGMDVVFDAVGGETLERSWNVLKPGGRLVTIAADSEGTTEQRVKDAFFIVEPNQKQLMEIAKLIDGNQLKTSVNAAVSLDEASAAYYGELKNKRGYGKVVVSVQT
jgi:NADPH:quinone reductase-like Zn-dependent oxidoreductase